MSTAVIAFPPFGEDGEDQSADEAFLASLPAFLRNVSARRELTREGLPRRGDSMDEPQLSAASQRVWDAEKREARCLAEKHRALAELYMHDGEYEEAAEVDAVETTRAALALRVTGSAAGWHLRDAHQAVHLFPRCLEALESGKLPSTWFQKMLKSSRSLSDSSRKNLDVAVATWSPDISPERFFTLLKKILSVLQEREDRSDPASTLTRSVDLLPCLEPGMGTIQISGPIPEILTQWKRLDESARAVQAAQRTALREGTPIPHDPDGEVLRSGKSLSLATLRFALLAGAVLDTDGVELPAERFRLNVTVPALTLLGASDEPGMLDGTIPLPPSMARALAGDCEVWHRVLTGAASGAFLPLPAEKFVPTTAMLEHLRLRNGMCAVPGCTRPTSWASECDHIEECRRGTPDAGALTEIENLHLLCWQHHLDKTNGLLDPTRLPTAPTEPGRTRWAVGRDGADVVTVIDDLDTASITIAEELATAWTSFLRGTHAGEPTTWPTDDDPADQGRPGRVIPLERREASSEESLGRPPGSRPPSLTDSSSTESASPVEATDPPRVRPDPALGESETPPTRREIPPGPWGDQGPPPF